jgi:acyl-CoA synthetase (NDP forming)
VTVAVTVRVAVIVGVAVTVRVLVAVSVAVRVGVLVIVGVSVDAQFGHVIMCGLGGVLVEVLHDVTFRLIPLQRRDARGLAHILHTHLRRVVVCHV